VKDQGIGRTLHIDRLAVVAAPPPVGHQGIGLLVTTTEELQVLQGLFEDIQFLGQTEQIFLGGLFGVDGLVGGAAPCG
jgi:hypothetical protein